MRPPVELGQNAGPLSPCGAVWESLGLVRASPHCSWTRLCEDPSVTLKTPPGASRGLGSSHSNSIGDGAVGPPRSGFVLRLCIRKTDEAWLKPGSLAALRIQVLQKGAA